MPESGKGVYYPCAEVEVVADAPGAGLYEGKHERVEWGTFLKGGGRVNPIGVRDHESEQGAVRRQWCFLSGEADLSRETLGASGG